MKRIIYLVGIFTSTLLLSSSTGQSAHKDPTTNVYKLIRTLQPALSTKDAQSLSTALYKAISHDADHYIDWPTLLSMAYQESSLKKDIVSQSGDVGLMQFSRTSIKTRKLNAKLLKTNEYYSLTNALKLLKDHSFLSKQYKFWVGSYNAGLKFNDPAVQDRAKRYYQSVARRANKIKNLYKDIELKEYFVAKR